MERKRRGLTSITNASPGGPEVQPTLITQGEGPSGLYGGIVRRNDPSGSREYLVVRQHIIAAQVQGILFLGGGIYILDPGPPLSVLIVDAAGQRLGSFADHRRNPGSAPEAINGRSGNRCGCPIARHIPGNRLAPQSGEIVGVIGHVRQGLIAITVPILPSQRQVIHAGRVDVECHDTARVIATEKHRVIYDRGYRGNSGTSSRVSDWASVV